MHMQTKSGISFSPLQWIADFFWLVMTDYSETEIASWIYKKSNLNWQTFADTRRELELIHTYS